MKKNIESAESDLSSISSKLKIETICYYERNICFYEIYHPSKYSSLFFNNLAYINLYGKTYTHEISFFSYFLLNLR